MSTLLRFGRLLPAAILALVVVIVPAQGAESVSGGVRQAPPQGGGSRGGSQTSPPQSGQRTQPGPEQFLQRSEWWKDADIRKELSLSDLQVRRISNIFDGRVREVTPFYEEFQKQIMELERMTRERTVDVATYQVQVNRAEALRSKLNETRTVMLYRIYRELNPDQYQKLREIQDRRRSGRGGNAPFPRTW